MIYKKGCIAFDLLTGFIVNTYVIGVEFIGTIDSFFILREDSSYLLREDGTKFMRENA